MPALDSGALTILRSGGDFVRRYFSPAVVTIIFAARIAAGGFLTDSYTGGVYAIAYDTITTGAPEDALPGYTLLIGTTAGAQDVGVMVIRKTASGGNLLVGEIAQGELKLPLAVGQYLTVIDQRRPHLRLPRIVPVYAMDGVTVDDHLEYADFDEGYTNQNSAIPPKANISSGLSDDGTVYLPVKPAGFVDAGETFRTMTLTSLGSDPVAGGATLGTPTWDVGDGSIADGTVNSPTITVQFPVGYRMIVLTMPSSNGASHTMYQPIWVHDADHMPLTNFKVTGDETEDWREVSLEFSGADNSVDETVYPRGTVGCYWEVATFAGGAAPGEYRSHTLGWVTEDAVTLRKFNGRYTVKLAGLGWWLESFNGFPHEMIDTGAAPTRHFEMQAITCDRMFHWQARHYSNALDLANAYFTGETNPTKGFEIGEDSLWRQMQEVQGQNVVSVLKSDSCGALWCRRDYILLTATQRASRARGFDALPRDWRDDPGLALSERQTNKVGIVTMGGETVVGGTAYPLLAQAPGLTLGRVPGRQEGYFQRLPSAGGLQVLLHLVGREWGRQNAPRGEFSIELIGNMDVVEPAWNEPITVTWLAASPRGTTLNQTEVMVRAASIEHGNAPGDPPKRITWRVEEVTSGQPGMEVPAESIPGSTPEEIVFSGLLTEASPLGPGRLAFVEANGYLYWTDDARPDSPVYARVSLGLGTLTRKFGLAGDPDSPLYQGESNQVDAVLATRTGIYTLTDVYNDYGARALTLRHTFSTALDTSGSTNDRRIVAFSPTDPSVVYVFSWYIGSYSPEKVTVIRSTNGGVTWGTEHALPGHASGSPAVIPAIALSDRDPDRLYALIFDEERAPDLPTEPGGWYGHIYRSGDGGANWSDNSGTRGVSLHASGRLEVLHFPYAGNSAELKFIETGMQYQTTDVCASADLYDRLYRVQGTAVDADLSPYTTPDCDADPVLAFSTSPLNANRAVADIGGTLYASTTGGVSWTDVDPGFTLGTDGVIWFDDDASAFIAWGSGGYLAFTNDMGAHWLDKRGNLGGFSSPGIGSMSGLIGG